MPTRPTLQAARSLRRNANTPETKAWAALRTLRAQGFAVRRQHPIGGYIVDFAIVKARLVIEIDGGVHDREDIAAQDQLRERDLNALGWRVLRVPAGDALHADYLIRRVSAELGL